jgi:hypothetical protein
MASHATPTVGMRTWRSIASAAPFVHRRGRSQFASARVLGAGSSPGRYRLGSSTRPWRCSRPVGRPSRSRKRSPSAPHGAVRRCPDYSPEGWHEVGARLGMRAVAAARSSSAPTLTPGEFGGPLAVRGDCRAGSHSWARSSSRVHGPVRIRYADPCGLAQSSRPTARNPTAAAAPPPGLNDRVGRAAAGGAAAALVLATSERLASTGRVELPWRARGASCSLSAPTRARGVADEMRVRQRRQVSVGRREPIRGWLVHA